MRTILIAGLFVIGCGVSTPTQDTGILADGDTTDGDDARCQTGRVTCASECVDLETNDQHCGQCGLPCAAGQSCSRGMCVIEPSCSQDAECGQNARCVSGGDGYRCVCDQGFDGDGQICTRDLLDWEQEPLVVAPAGEVFSLSADGLTMAVGIPRDGSSSSYPGEVRVLVLRNDRWEPEATVRAADAGALDLFGASVSLSADGNTLAVGAPFEDGAISGVNVSSAHGGEGLENQGAAYVFQRRDGRWLQQAYIKATNTFPNPDPGAYDEFGRTVELSPDGLTLAVAATGEDSSTTGINPLSDHAALDSGAVYVFALDDEANGRAQWSQQAFIKAGDSGAGDLFGFSLALSQDGDVLVVGAPYEDNGLMPGTTRTNSGAAYVFERDNSWRQRDYLKSAGEDDPDGFSEGDLFAYSVAVSSDGQVLAIGARDRDVRTPTGHGPGGSVSVFGFADNTWRRAAYVTPDVFGRVAFGSSVSLSGDGRVLVVGSPDYLDGSLVSTGAASVYTNSPSGWSLERMFKPTDASGGGFGRSTDLSFDGSLMLIGGNSSVNFYRRR